MNNLEKQTITLAAVCQTAVLVQNIARTGAVEESELGIMLNSIMVTSPDNILDVYSNDIAHLKSGLKERAVKSVGITLAAQAVKLLLQLGSIVILARLLEPSDFGLIAMVTVFTGLALQFMEGGLSMATIQRDQITHGQVSNLSLIHI